jgi:hypothetical protein
MNFPKGAPWASFIGIAQSKEIPANGITVYVAGSTKQRQQQWAIWANGNELGSGMTDASDVSDATGVSGVSRKTNPANSLGIFFFPCGWAAGAMGFSICFSTGSDVSWTMLLFAGGATGICVTILSRQTTCLPHRRHFRTRMVSSLTILRLYRTGSDVQPHCGHTRPSPLPSAMRASSSSEGRTPGSLGCDISST